MMQVRDVLAFLALMFAAAPAAAAPHVLEDGASLRLEPGQRVVVRLAPGGRLELVAAQPAPPDAALPPRPGARPPDDPLTDAAPGTIAVVLGQGALRLDSGLDQALDFTARDDQARPLKVCTALPLLASYESWPYPVAAVTLSGFRTRPTNEVVCTATTSPGKH